MNNTIGTQSPSERKPYYRYPPIRHLGDAETEGIFLDEVIIQEKVDGANAQAHIHNGELVFGSRNVLLGPTPGHDWTKMAQYFREKTGGNLNPDFVYFFEYMKHHTVNYDLARTPTILGFDILDKNTELFLGADVAKKEFERVGIEFVPMLFRKKGQDVKVEELKSFVETNKSAFAETPGEGIVIKNHSRLNRFGRPLFGKIVREVFREQNKLAFTGLKELRDNERNIVLEYATPRRIEKSIQKLTLEEGKEMSMKLMPDLFKYVSDDILIEEVLSISKQYGSIHFKEFRTMVAAECAKVLKQKLLELAK